MLQAFVTSNRDAIIAMAQASVAKRAAPRPTGAELHNGIPVFLDQLRDALHLAKSSDEVGHDQIKESAGRHGHDLFRMGLTVDQVVHDYGDVCQAVTELAVNQGAQISAGEFRTLNLCLDDAIAGAVTAYARQREEALAHHGTERLGIFAQELRNVLNTAMLSFESIHSGRVAPGGSTAMVLGRSLMGLRDLIDRSLAEVRLDAGEKNTERISAAEFIEEVEIGASIQARARGIDFAVATVDRTLLIEGDRQILAAALSNLLQNAFKFTVDHGHVSLTTRATAERVLFEVEDECGGLPPGKAEELLLPADQRGPLLGSLGLGLTISLKAARANGGEIRVRDLPNKGCVFTLDLRRMRPPPLSLVDGGGRTPAQGTETPKARAT